LSFSIDSLITRLFPGHAYGDPVLRPLEVLARLDREALVAHYRGATTLLNESSSRSAGPQTDKGLWRSRAACFRRAGTGSGGARSVVASSGSPYERPVMPRPAAQAQAVGSAEGMWAADRTHARRTILGRRADPSPGIRARSVRPQPARSARLAWYGAFFEVAGVDESFAEDYTRAVEAVTADELRQLATVYSSVSTVLRLEPSRGSFQGTQVASGRGA